MNPKSFKPQVQPWKIIHENKEYSTPIFELLKRRIRLQSNTDSSEGDFYILDAPAWINVIALTAAEEVILVEQYRHGIQKPTLEIPGGLVDAGEQPLEAVKRELLEEAGYTSKKWSSLGSVSANPSMMNNYTHMFVAEDCTFTGAQHLDEHERIHVHTVPLDGFLGWVEDGTIHHAIVLAAVARFLLKRQAADDKR